MEYLRNRVDIKTDSCRADSYQSLAKLFAIASLLLGCGSVIAQQPICTVSASPPATAAAPVAPGTPVTLSANCTNSPTSYSWSPSGETTQSVVVSTSTSKTVSLTACNNAPTNFCSAVVSITVYATSAAAVQFVTVEKTISYVQTSATDVNVDPRPPGPLYGGPYWFGINVNGPNLSGITPPAFSGPINTAALGSFYNSGKLVYNASEGGWKAGAPNANNWGGTQSNRDSIWGNGTYTITAQGFNYPLQLTGDAYPNAPRMIFGGGSWSNGKYVIAKGKPLTITTNAFTAYGSYPNAVISIEPPFDNGSVQLFAAIPGLPFPAVPASNFASYTVPASAFTAGQDYTMGVTFQAIVDFNTNPALPGIVKAASYNAYTTATVSVTNPVFPMVVTGAASVNTPVATVSAAIQYRPQDVGTTGNVYVFALAPANKVLNVAADALTDHKGPVAKGSLTTTSAGPVPCVLAQLTASGQLTSVTASTMQAYLTGVLSSQGATVSVLNGISTALVSGAVFYVGYGTSSTTMINSGINQRVVTVPGTLACDPQAPQTGWWWNAAEDGRGFSVEVRGNNLFFAGYLYEPTGAPIWVGSVGPVTLDGSLYNGTLYRVSNGQTLTGTYKGEGTAAPIGPVTLAFTDARNGTLIWPGGSTPIVRFDSIIGSGNGQTPAFVPETGWWWNPAESGRGFFMEWKNNYAFLAGYMYDTNGAPIWYATQNPMVTPNQYTGSWFKVENGQALTGPYKKPDKATPIGSLAIQFQDQANATLTLPDGRPIPLTRHRF